MILNIFILVLAVEIIAKRPPETPPDGGPVPKYRCQPRRLWCSKRYPKPPIPPPPKRGRGPPKDGWALTIFPGFTKKNYSRATFDVWIRYGYNEALETKKSNWPTFLGEQGTNVNCMLLIVQLSQDFVSDNSLWQKKKVSVLEVVFTFKNINWNQILGQSDNQKLNLIRSEIYWL